MKILGIENGKLLLSQDILVDQPGANFDGKYYLRGTHAHYLAEKGDLENRTIQAAKRVELGNQVISGETVVEIDLAKLTQLAYKAAFNQTKRANQGAVKAKFSGNKGFRAVLRVK